MLELKAPLPVPTCTLDNMPRAQFTITDDWGGTIGGGWIRAELGKPLLDAISNVESEAESYRVIKRVLIDKGITPDRVIEMAEADVKGRMYVLPCKVGDVIHADGSSDMRVLHVSLCVSRDGVMTEIPAGVIATMLQNGTASIVAEAKECS